MENGKGYVSEQIQDLLKEISMNISHILAKEIDISPLTVHQLYIMKLIKKKPETNLTSLCNELSLSKGSMSLTVNRLVEEGYVYTKENFSDRRNKNINLTEKGEMILKDTTDKSIRILTDITSTLSKNDLEDIKKSLQKLNTSIHEAIHRNDDFRDKYE